MAKRTFEQRLKIYDRGLGTVSAAAIVIGGLFTVYTYLKDQRNKENEGFKLREREWVQRQQDLLQRQKELALTVFKEKREAYLALTDAASAIAACRTYEEVESASKEFLKLYYGRAHIIPDGDDDVYNRKIAFRRALGQYLRERPSETPDIYFENLALDITDACKSHIDPRSVDGTKAPEPSVPDKPRRETSTKDKSSGGDNSSDRDKSSSDKSSGEKSWGEKSSGNKSSGDKSSKASRPKTEQTPGDRRPN